MNTGNMSNDEANVIGNFIEQFNLYNTQLPFKGMTIKHITNSPKIEIQGYCFVGTWENCINGYKLIGVNWQNRKTGEVIGNEQMFDKIFIF